MKFELLEENNIVREPDPKIGGFIHPLAYCCSANAALSVIFALCALYELSQGRSAEVVAALSNIYHPLKTLV